MGQLAKLQIDHARELLEIVHKITLQPLVLILDQWEKSPGLRTDGNFLDSFLRPLSDWPPCHVFVGARPDPEVLKTLERLKSFPDVGVHPLELMNLTSRSNLIRFLHEKVTSSLAISDDDLLDFIDGYPGTLYRWTHRAVSSTLCTRADFMLEAKNAELNRFPEFGELLSNLEDQSSLLSIRLTLKAFWPESVKSRDWAEPILRSVSFLGLAALARTGGISSDCALLAQRIRRFAMPVLHSLTRRRKVRI